jgi:hypothetical protein
VRIGLAVCLAVAGCSALWPVNRADPRFAACGGNDENAEAAFPLVASEYRQHFPQMGESPELEGAGDAFAVVFNPEYVPATFGFGQPQPAGPGMRYVCVYVGMPPNGSSNLYSDVDITGMRP